MVTKEHVKTISKLAFPIAIAQSSLLAMSLIDLAMVGSLGNNAVAAVGLAVFTNALIVSFVVGITPAVQGLVARRRGEGSTEPKCLALNGGLVVALAVGIPLTLICWILGPFFFSLISSDPDVTKIGVPFLRTIFIGLVGDAINFAFKGYWSGMEKPKIYMSIVIIMDCVNIVTNYVFIFGHFGAPALGATGAAVGTVVALFTGVAVNAVITSVKFRKEGFLTARPPLSLLARIATLGVPATMQEIFLEAGYVVFFWLVGRVGTVELAAGNVVVRITMVLLLFSMSLGNASATLVSRTLGEGDPAGAAEWGWDSGKMGVIGITILGLPLVLFPRAFLSIFLTDPHTMSIAVLPMQLVGATAGIVSLLYIFAYTLFSVGDGKRVMLVSLFTTWLVLIPGVWFVGPHLHYGLLQIILVQGAASFMATGLVTSFWAGGRWQRIAL